MNPPVLLQLDVMARRLMPFGLTVILVVLGSVPLHIPEYARVAPMLPLMAVYHWAIFRPDTMPAYAVFIIGLMQDALMGMPIGVNALVYLAVYGIVLSQRRFFFGKSFAVLWMGFVVVAAGASLAGWVLVSGFYATLVEPRAVFFQYLMSVGVFPLLAWIFLRWQQAFLAQD